MEDSNMKRLAKIAVVTALAFSGLAILRAQSVAQIDYDSYCKLADVTAKREAFFATTPENRGVLVRTQIERWRDANKARLSEVQLTFLAELLATVTPDTYADGPKGEEARQKSRPLAAKSAELFSRADNEAMQPNGPCIPKAK